MLVLLGRSDAEMRQPLDAARTQLAARGIDLERVDLEHAPDRTTARALTMQRSARGVFWFDRSTPDEIGVFLAAHDGSTFVRRVSEPSPQARLEAVFLIVEHGSVALAAGDRVAMETVEEEEEPIEEPEPDPPSQPEPEPAPESVPAEPTAVETGGKPRARFGVSLAYRGESFASNLPWQSGAALGAYADLGRSLRVGVEYAFVAPWDSPRSDVRLPVGWRHGPSLHIGVRSELTNRFELSARLVGSVDLVHWRATDAGSQGVRVMGVVGPEIALRIRLVREAFLELSPGVGVVLNRFAFVECEASATTCAADDRRTLVDPWRFRPRLNAGLAYRF